jgi:hypothetical protein
MIAHQNPRMHTPSAHSAGLTKPVEENLAVIVGLKHHLPSVATSHDMVNCPWILKTSRPSHHLPQPPESTGSSYNCDTAGTDPSKTSNERDGETGKLAKVRQRALTVARNPLTPLPVRVTTLSIAGDGGGEEVKRLAQKLAGNPESAVILKIVAERLVR